MKFTLWSASFVVRQVRLPQTSPKDAAAVQMQNLGFVNDAEYDKLNSEVIEIKRILIAFIQKLRADRQLLNRLLIVLLITHR